MRDLTAELKALRLYGMAEAWVELAGPAHGAGVETSRWLLEHLLQAEATDRAMRSVRYQITSAPGGHPTSSICGHLKFPQVV